MMSETENMLRSYLEGVHRLRTSNHPERQTLEGVVMQQGRYFEPAPLPEDVEAGTPKECFRNAWHLMLSRDDLIYCEGWGVPDTVPIPLEHAWCVDRDGRVVDPTWKSAAGYYGIPLQKEFVLGTTDRTRIFGVLNNYTEKWPVLRLPPDQFVEPLGPELSI